MAAAATEPTVTDANLRARARCQRETLLAGTLRLDAARARARDRAHRRQAARPRRVAARAGIMRIVNTQMAVDLRLALQEQGQDPRTLRARRLRRRGAAARRDTGAQRRHPDRAGAALSRHQLRAWACCRPACAIPICGRRSASLSRFPTARMNELFAALEAQALRGGDARRASRRGRAKLTRLLDLRYPHQGYTLGGRLSRAVRRGRQGARSSTPSTSCISQVYGQSRAEARMPRS